MILSKSLFVIGQSCVLFCKDSLFAPLDSNCNTSIKINQLLFDSTSCLDLLNLDIFDQFGDNVDNQFDKTHIGKKFTAKLSITQNPATYCTVVFKIVDTSGPVLQCKDLYTDCKSFSQVTDNVLPLPTITDNCSQVAGLEHFDQHYELGCTNIGFAGALSPDKWLFNSSCFDDAQFNVSPNKDSLSMVAGLTNNICQSVLSMFLPVDGKITFGWSIDSLTLTASDSFGILVDGYFIRLNKPSIHQGFFNSKNLKKGSQISFVIFSDGIGNEVKSHVFDFQIESNVKSFIERTWKAKDVFENESSCVQHIYVLKNYLSEVQFPPDFTDSLKTQNNCGVVYNPEITGWPFIKTGKYTTFAGITQLKSGQNECLEVKYTDVTMKICEGSSEINRIWTVFEHCSGDSITYKQLIKVLDVAPPVITGKKYLSFTVHDYECFADVTLPDFDAVDKCSPINMVKDVSTNFGSNGNGPYFNIPIGKYQVVYSATDGCGNKSSKISELEVIDKTAPVSICKQNLSFSLDQSGQSLVSANQIDGGSFDNCCLEFLKIKRKNDPVSAFSYSINLTCEDINYPMLTLISQDCYGNTSFCNSVIQVFDNQAPNVKCPKDVTINCLTDISNLDLFGNPVVLDNCKTNTMYSFTSDLNTCNEGKIVRTWIVSDFGNNKAICNQNIQIINEHTWNQNNDKIKWPADYTTEECKMLSDVKPANLPFGFGQPTIVENSKCTKIDVKYEDNFYGINGTSCIQLQRKWTIIEKCSFEASKGSGGKWEHTQFIKIIDKEVPVLTVPSDVTVQIFDNSCSKFVSLSPVVVSDCDPDPLISNSKTNKSNNLSANYQVGVNKVEVTAADHCGNGVTKTVTITVLDGVPPQVHCKQNLTINLANLDNQNEMTILPSMISNGFSDNCTPDFLIQTSVTPQKISCKDIGNKMVFLTATDQSGNSAVCSTEINVTDLNGLCNKPVLKISGNLKTPNGIPITKADLQLTGGVTSILQNNADGSYTFDNLTKGADYKLAAGKNIVPLNGVTTFDLLLLNEHILGKKLLDSPYKYVAADVNQNNFITTADYVILKKLLLLDLDSFPNNTSWRFIPQSYKFVNYHPILPLYPEEIFINNLQQDYIGADFVGVKLGDLNFSNNPNQLAENEKRNSDIISLRICPNISNLPENHVFPVIIQSENSLKGIQFELNAQDLNNNKIEIRWPENSKCSENDVKIDELGQDFNLRLSWVSTKDDLISNGDTLFYFVCSGPNVNGLIETLHFVNERLKAEAYDDEYATHDAELIKDVIKNEVPDEIQVEIYPNPVNTNLNILIQSKFEMMGDFSLFDLQGRQVISKSTNLTKGRNCVIFDQMDLLTTGIYFLKITTNSGTVCHKKIYVIKH